VIRLQSRIRLDYPLQDSGGWGMLLNVRFSGLVALFVLGITTAQASSVAQVKARGELVVLSFAHHKVFFEEVAADRYSGIEYDLMQAFAKSLDVRLVIRQMPFADLIPALLRGDGDVIASSFSITPAREKLVNYSNPYFPVLVMIVGRDGVDAAAPADLKGRSMCIVQGSSQEERIDALVAVEKHYASAFGECFDVLERGEADFTLMDSTRVLLDLDGHPKLRHLFDLPGADRYSFAVAPGSDLKAELDRFLLSIRRSSYIYFVVEKHLGRKGVEFYRMAQDQH
jgi:ABC-type amino acid transport substrate-binding protein